MTTLSQGQRINLEGIVTRIMRSAYEINDGSLSYNIATSERLSLGDVVKIVGIVEGDVINTQSITILPIAEAKQRSDEIKKKMLENIKVNDIELLVNDEVTQALKPEFMEMAKYLLLAQKLNRSILLRFHSDADGISAAFAITKFLRCKAEQQNAAIYNTRDAIRDLNNLNYQYAPLAVFVDFGASQESIEALKLLHSAGVEIIIIDHHPPVDEVTGLGILLSPWQVHDDPASSQYPAGYLACEIARAAGIEGIDYLAKISCAGDKSKIIEIDEIDKDKALVLDFLAIYSGYGNNLDFYRNAIENNDLFKSVLQQAKDKMKNIYETAIKLMKKHNAGELALYVVELDNIIKEQEFPSRGKIVTMISETLGNERPIIILGYGKKTIVIRLNQLAADAGYSAEQLISELKVSMKDFIESGGGHTKAAAIRTQEGYAKSVCDALVELIKSK